MYRTATLFVLSVAFNPALSQQAPSIHGLTGGLALGSISWDLGSRGERQAFIWGLNTGYLVPVGSRLAVTPQISVMATEFRGIPVHSNDVGVSRADLGLQVSIRLRALHPYALFQLGRVTTEQYVDTNLVNYSASMPAFGGGIRWQRGNNPCGAGPELTVRHTAGDLTSGEWRIKDSLPPSSGHFAAWIVSVGWTGSFRGNRLLFQCR